MSRPVIRAAINSDQDVVRALIFSVLDEYDIDPAPKTTDRDLYGLEAYYHDGMFAVMENSDGDIIGTVGLAPLSATVCELRKMYLKPGDRGKGLGGKLLNHAIARARTLGFSRIELNTKRIMEEAIGLYTKHGFVLVDGAPVDQRCDKVLVLDL